MWKYIKKYLHFAIIAGLFMVGEVVMDLLQPSIMSEIVDDGVLGINNQGVGDMFIIFRLGIVMIILVLFGGFCGSMNNVFVHQSSQNIGNDIRKDCFAKIMTFSFPQIDKYGTGSLVTRVTNDITQVQNFIAQFVRGMIRTGLMMVGSIYFIYRLNPTYGKIVLCAFPLLVGCLVICLYKANPYFSKLQKELDAVNELMQEDVSGIRVIKAYVHQAYEKIRFGKVNDSLIKTQLHVLVIFAFMNPVINALMYIVVAILLWVGNYQVIALSTTPGVIMAAISYTTQLLNGILGLVMLFQNISRGIVSWGRVKEILNTTPDIQDGEALSSNKKGEIEFKDVSFAYNSNSPMVLSHIQLHIKPGETIAIMGTTGCGKSTLINLIPRFYDVLQGGVYVDGLDVRDYKKIDLRNKIGIVLQKNELFSDTIKENILWGNPDASDEQVKNAAAIAQADEFIMLTTNDYDTMVAERGNSLSGGQKQRLSIARAIVKEPEILIFDDSTSALDLKTEANLYAALQKFSPDSTKIIVAQRIASIRNADRIVVLEHGQIVACDRHDALMKNCQVYQDIYYSQMGKDSDIYE